MRVTYSDTLIHINVKLHPLEVFFNNNYCNLALLRYPLSVNA